MAANTRSTSATWGQGALVKSAQFEIVESNAAKAVSRYSTSGGWKSVPTTYMGASPASGTAAVSSFLRASAGFYVIATSPSAVRNNFFFDIIGLPPGHSLTTVTLVLDPASGHTASPGLMPKTVIYRVASTGATAIASASATWTNTSSYEASVTLTNSIATASRTITADYRYVVAFGNEGGSDSAGDMRIRTINAYVTVDTTSGGADFTFWR